MQPQANGVVPNQGTGSVAAGNAPRATLRLMVNTVNRVVTEPVANPVNNTIRGLVNANIAFPACSSWLGSQGATMDVANQRSSTLKVQCPQASTLRLSNVDGQCLHVALPRAQRIEVAGNRTISLILPPTDLPSSIDVSGMTHWGPPGRSSNNTRVLIRTSLLQAHGDAMNRVRIEGRLKYAVPFGAFGVVVEGCNVAAKVVCVVRDKSNAPTCCLIDTCTDSVVVARQRLQYLMESAPPCLKP